MEINKLIIHLERELPGEFRAQHDHPRHPKVEYIHSCNQHSARVVARQQLPVVSNSNNYHKPSTPQSLQTSITSHVRMMYLTA